MKVPCGNRSKGRHCPAVRLEPGVTEEAGVAQILSVGILRSLSAGSIWPTAHFSQIKFYCSSAASLNLCHHHRNQESKKKD